MLANYLNEVTIEELKTLKDECYNDFNEGNPKATISEELTSHVDKINHIIDLNRQLHEIEAELSRYSRESYTPTKFSDIYSVFLYIKRTIKEEQKVLAVTNEILSNNKEAAFMYLRSNNYLDKGKQEKINFFNSFLCIIDDFDLLFRWFFSIKGEDILNNIFRLNITRGGTPLEEKSAELKLCNTHFRYLIPHLQTIFKIYGERFFEGCRRSPKKMFIFYYLFQEYMTDEMFDAFVKRMKTYRKQLYIDYAIYRSRHIPDEWLEKMKAMKLFLSMKGNLCFY